MAEKLEFLISLKELVSASAEKASGGLKHLTSELKESQGKLASFQRQLRLANDLGDIEGHRKYASLVAATKKEVFELGEKLEGAKHGMSASAAGFGEMAKEALIVPAAIGGVALALSGLALEGAHLALEVTEVNEKLTATFEALGNGPGAGKATLGMLNEMSKELPQSRDQLAGWTKQFQAMGYTDLGALREQIKATASAQAIMGDEGAAAYTSLTERINVAVEAHTGLKLGERTLKQLYAAGLNATDVADRMGVSVKQLEANLKAGKVDAEKFGQAMSSSLIEKGEKPLEAMGNEVGTLKRKLGETLSHLFDDVDTSPITDALKSVIDLGDQGEPSGQALKAGVTGGINGIVKAIGGMIHEGELAFLDMEIWWLKNRHSIDDAAEGIKTLISLLEKAGKAAAWMLGGTATGVAKVATGVGAASKEGATTEQKLGGGVKAAEGIGDYLTAVIPPAFLAKKVADWISHSIVDAVGGNKATGLPGHAHGGIVTRVSGGLATVRPAAGEGLASIGAGERIIPRDHYANVSHRMVMPANNTQGGGGGVHVDRLDIHITAPHGVTGAQELSVTGLTLALERLQLASGR